MSEPSGSGNETESEGLLLEALALGSEQQRDAAFEQVYERYAAVLMRASAAISPTYAQAEDAVQEAFIGLVRKGSRTREIRNLRAYLFTAAIRAARRISQQTPASLRLDVDLPAATLPVSATVDAPSGNPALESALARLPHEQREAVRLHIDGGLTFEEIGEALQISAATAASRYRYALEKLRVGLDAETPLRTVRE